MIYLDNAATTRTKPQAVIDAVVQAMQTMGNSGRGAHDDALSASRIIYDTRVKLAALFGCDAPERVIFTSNSTEALNIAISGLFSPEDHVISTDCEHNSVLRPLYRHGNVSFVPADAQGQLDYSEFGKLLRPNTQAVVCTHASNLTGDLLDLERISAFCRENGLLFVVDASQTAGVIPIDMTQLGIDVLCFTGHKSLMGPQGTGGLCIAKGVELRPFKVGGTGVQTYAQEQPAEYPTRLEAGTLNSHGIAGLNAALNYINAIGMDTIRQKEIALAKRFYELVTGIDGVTVYGDFSSWDRAAIVTLNIRDLDSAQVSDYLSEYFGIATRPGGHCAPRLHQALGTVERGAVRFSFGWHNTEYDVDMAVRAIAEVARP
ncbi:MAG: aminotransferase class V-fold PLP-dependent enzyme [Oscillospiraceae bacterium]|nr:aminotransferase class V-fold PLP-dependent enzyme [Oscillospiraceae bacterium]